MTVVTTEFVSTLADASTADLEWAQQKGEQVAASVAACIRNIENDQGWRRAEWLKQGRLYSSAYANQLTIARTAAQSATTPTTTPRALVPSNMKMNVVKSCIDTAASKLGKARPRPLFLTNDGDAAQRDRAEELGKYVDGLFDVSEAYVQMQRAFVDSMIWGTGCVHGFVDWLSGRVRVERVIVPEEIRVDEIDGKLGSPREMHRVKVVERARLLKIFPKKRQVIEGAPRVAEVLRKNGRGRDVVEVRESWRLPTGTDTGDGRHVITVENGVLFDEEWEADAFPFVFLRWTDDPCSFYGQGLAAELAPVQVEINRLLHAISVAQMMMAVPRVFIDKASGVDRGSLTDVPGQVTTFVGRPPIFNTSPAMAGEVYSHLNWLVMKAYEIAGISQMSATGKKPAGLDSGVAIREAQDIETERFALVSQRFEEAHLQLARLMVRLTRDLAEEQDVSVKVSVGRNSVKEISWKDVEMDEDDFVLRCFPTSLLPTQPAAKLQRVTELVQSQFIDKDTGLELLDFPDVQAYVNSAVAERRVAEKTIDDIVKTGEYTAPDPLINVDIWLDIAKREYFKALQDKRPEESLDALAAYIDELERKKPAPPAPPPQPPQEVPALEGQMMPPDMQGVPQ